MKIQDFQAILKEAEKFYSDSGDKESAASITELRSGLDPIATKSVSDFVKMVSKARSTV